MEKLVETHPDARAIYNTDDGVLFVSDDPREWNKKNIELNPDEYYKIGFVSGIRNALDTNRYRVGYGVVEYDTLTKALETGAPLYLATLFHKRFEAIKEDSMISCNITNNGSQALYMTLMRRKGITNIDDLLNDILSLSMRGYENRRKYVEVNKDILREMFGLYYGNDVYQVYEDKHILTSFNKLFDRRTILLPPSLVSYYDNKGIEKYDEDTVHKATNQFIKDNRLPYIYDLNTSYIEGMDKKESYSFKR